MEERSLWGRLCRVWHSRGEHRNKTVGAVNCSKETDKKTGKRWLLLEANKKWCHVEGGMRADICPLSVRGVRGGDGLYLTRAEQMSGWQEGFPTPLHHTFCIQQSPWQPRANQELKSKMREGEEKKKGGGGTRHQVMIVMELMTHRPVVAGCCNLVAPTQQL